jgi:hypothetical protein
VGTLIFLKRLDQPVERILHVHVSHFDPDLVLVVEDSVSSLLNTLLVPERVSNNRNTRVSNTASDRR